MKTPREKSTRPSTPTQTDTPVDRGNFEGFAVEKHDTKVEGSRRDQATNAPLDTSDGGAPPPPFQQGVRRPHPR